MNCWWTFLFLCWWGRLEFWGVQFFRKPQKWAWRRPWGRRQCKKKPEGMWHWRRKCTDWRWFWWRRTSNRTWQKGNKTSKRPKCQWTGGKRGRVISCWDTQCTSWCKHERVLKCWRRWKLAALSTRIQTVLMWIECCTITIATAGSPAWSLSPLPSKFWCMKVRVKAEPWLHRCSGWIKVSSQSWRWLKFWR